MPDRDPVALRDSQDPPKVAGAAPPAVEHSTPRPQKTTDSLVARTEVAPDNVAATAAFELPQSVGRFTELEILGQGGFGAVYRAYDPELKRHVALKIPRLGGADDAFLEEARSAARLKHPNIVTIYDVGRSADGLIFIAMELVDGPTLAKQMRNATFSPIEAARLIAVIARAVHFAHNAGVVHRDLKPGNILIDGDGTPKVADFGLAIHEDQQPPESSELVGTPAYMAPEQVSGSPHQIDRRTDVWALGVILYQLLSGRMPFDGTRKEIFDRIVQQDPESLRSINTNIPEEMERVCRRCLAKNADDRPQQAIHLAQELEQFSSSHVDIDVDSSRSVRDHVPLMLSPRRWLITTGLACLALLGIWFGQPLWSGAGSAVSPRMPDEDVSIVPTPTKTSADLMLEQDRSAILKPRDPRWHAPGGQVLPLVWQPENTADSWAFEESTGRLAIHCMGVGLISLGQARAESTSLRSTLKRDHRGGEIGMFWGVQKHVDGVRRCQMVVLGRVEDDDPFSVKVVEVEFQDHPLLGSHITLNRVWFRRQLEVPKQLEVNLQVEVHEGTLEQVLLNDDVVITAADLAEFSVPQTSISGHDVGVGIFRGSVLFKSFLIRE